MMSTPMPPTVVEELQRYLPLIELLSQAPGVEIVSWSQINFLLGACQIQPPDWDPNRFFEERRKVRMFFGWDMISRQLTRSRIISLEISASSPFHALSIQTIQAIEDYLNAMFKQLNMPPLPVRAVPFNLQERVDLRGWYSLSSGSNRAHYFSFLQYGNGLPEGQATCCMKVPYYELVDKEVGGKEMQFCNGCLRG